MSQPGEPADQWHTVTLKIPFHTSEHAVIARRALDVDREQNGSLVRREMNVEGDILVVNYATTSVRLLRLSTNSFLSSADLVLRTMSSFAPDPSDRIPTDEELEELRQEANRNTGVGRGIELKGDGKGAGSGEEVR
ncbi:hypothetical protein J008_05498 [Cryptococcus neoformans]|uniref:Transcription factor Pcc1 n=2 Tax=Cryptococcus neoformans TaxID=5207 RepID=A0A854Q794_CRYNE|nr:hypothetical protein CNAG_04667 [Cryptococcus neoformans var. grubii H99]AUB27583.1 hypothetical protein CKF44_04667 [Cryptococcus neoformans var. grubii]OWT36649.1 hypothetical protein C362_05766 [Cryptococcus neoformans var. grubii Bt1]OWZ28156.1 hypothetical protein C347_05732 [Cryptococcus neoformans var. grubii AD2-60a]OWZ33207.1 hypothetical protein C353_05591 [Cryptococcus neoformans var. grubii AD1-83a]OWZ40471.1 hypothetical protein C343_05694 [Cryptococcus neoformans var. grubii C|eukprot:XP_012052129.1 hypothetical protein CNAG_04667 [Cryptococcus neoformans var. grubii H99]